MTTTGYTHHQCNTCKEIRPVDEYKKPPKKVEDVRMCIHCHRAYRRALMSIYQQNNPEYRAKRNVRAKTWYLINSGKLSLLRKCCGCEKWEHQLDCRLELHHPLPYNPWTAYFMCKHCHDMEPKPERGYSFHLDLYVERHKDELVCKNSWYPFLYELHSKDE